jgi:prepilin-type N-terminal cleavage/methylation domain-containing protein
MKRSLRRSGFTLVELLVVIGIIALLISILLPALSRAKEQANRVLCMSNHKQLLMGIHMYANDNKNVFPHCNWLGQEDAARVPGWLYDSKLTRGSLKSLQGGAVWKYLKNDKVFRCPFDPPPWNRGPIHAISSYGFNGSVNGYGRNAANGYPVFTKTSQFKPSDIILWELDEYWSGGANIYNDGSNFPQEGITARHGSRGARDTNQQATRQDGKAGAIVSTVGQSVEWITLKAYFEEVFVPGTNTQKSGRTRLWNVPQAISASGH